MWIAGWDTASTRLTRVDAITNDASLVATVQEQWTPFDVGAGKLWLMGGREPAIRVAGLDLTDLRLGPSVVVGKLPAFEGSGLFDWASNAIWIAQYDRAVTRLELT